MRSEKHIISLIIAYFQKEIIDKHQNNLYSKHSKLSSYQINPILIKYLSQLVEGNITPEGIAKALFYPRALGTSISGTFGTKFQSMLVQLGIVQASLIAGLDVEYVDKLDGRRKYCQLKAGPNTINSGDVKPILDEFDKVANLARTNTALNFNNNDLILGILYGDSSQLSGHYQRINNRYPVIIGKEFWYRITGFPSFYHNMIIEIDQLIAQAPMSNTFKKAFDKLLNEIKKAKIV